MIQSPHFPTSYTRDYSNEIKLENVDPSPTSSIQLVFDDFQLGSLSLIEVLDANNSRIHTLKGNLQFRPPILVINGSQLTLRFIVNGGRGLGYQATYTFLNGKSVDVIQRLVLKLTHTFIFASQKRPINWKYLLLVSKQLLLKS